MTLSLCACRSDGRGQQQSCWFGILNCLEENWKKIKDTSYISLKHEWMNIAPRFGFENKNSSACRRQLSLVQNLDAFLIIIHPIRL